jgi:hypothetical protein
MRSSRRRQNPMNWKRKLLANQEKDPQQPRLNRISQNGSNRLAVSSTYQMPKAHTKSILNFNSRLKNGVDHPAQILMHSYWMVQDVTNLAGSCKSGTARHRSPPHSTSRLRWVKGNVRFTWIRFRTVRQLRCPFASELCWWLGSPMFPSLISKPFKVTLIGWGSQLKTYPSLQCPNSISTSCDSRNKRTSVTVVFQDFLSIIFKTSPQC